LAELLATPHATPDPTPTETFEEKAMNFLEIIGGPVAGAIGVVGSVFGAIMGKRKCDKNAAKIEEDPSPPPELTEKEAKTEVTAEELGYPILPIVLEIGPALHRAQTGGSANTPATATTQVTAVSSIVSGSAKMV
jgi:hypothetical protein